MNYLEDREKNTIINEFIQGCVDSEDAKIIEELQCLINTYNSSIEICMQLSKIDYLTKDRLNKMLLSSIPEIKFSIYNIKSMVKSLSADRYWR